MNSTYVPRFDLRIRVGRDLLEAGLLTAVEYDRLLNDLLYGRNTDKVCECGAEKCNLPHSHWCPKHEE